jgi:hypothetical protein
MLEYQVRAQGVNGKPSLQSRFTLFPSKFFPAKFLPAKFPFSKIQKKNLAGKNLLGKGASSGVN